MVGGGFVGGLRRGPGGRAFIEQGVVELDGAASAQGGDFFGADFFEEIAEVIVLNGLGCGPGGERPSALVLPGKRDRPRLAMIVHVGVAGV
jgi:hypothetical protein